MNVCNISKHRWKTTGHSMWGSGAFPSLCNHLISQEKKETQVTHTHTYRRTATPVRFSEDSITEGPKTNPIIWVFQS